MWIGLKISGTISNWLWKREEQIKDVEHSVDPLNGETIPSSSPTINKQLITMADEKETDALGAPGAFMASLIRNNTQIKRDRAANIFEEAEVRYRRTVEDLDAQLKRMKRDRDNKLDLSPTDKNTLMLAGDFDSAKFVDQDISTSLDIRNLEIKLQIAETRYAYLFKGEIAAPAVREEVLA